MLLPELSALGWFHTLGSLPAVPLALYLLIRHGFIRPATPLGKIYLAFMFLGAITGVLVIRDAPGVAISILSLGSLTVGALIGFVKPLASQRWWIETVAMSTSALTLFIPSVTETLTRLPADAPIAASPADPIVVAFQLTVLIGLFVLIPLQLRFLHRARQATVVA